MTEAEQKAHDEAVKAAKALLAKEDKEGGDGDPGGDGSGSGGSDGDDPGGDGEKGLAELGLEKLVEMITGLRGESGKYRKRAQKAEGTVGDLTKKVGKLEDAAKTDEEKETERLAEQEAQAALASKLAPYFERTKLAYDSEVERIDAIEDEPRKAVYKKALAVFGEDDYLGRLNTIEAIAMAEGARKEKEVGDGDEGNPNEIGTGGKEKSLADMLRGSEYFTGLARMAGMVPPEKKT